jgi:hypothetical protein
MISREKLLIGLIVLAVIAFVVVSIAYQFEANKNDKLESEMSLQSMDFELLSDGLARAESQLVSEKEFREALKESFGEQFSILKADLEELRARPVLVNHTTSVIEGDNVTVVDTDFPSEYKFLTQAGMPVALYTYRDRTFNATTYDLTVESAIVISEDKHGNRAAHVSGQVASSDESNEGWYPLDIVASKLTFVKPDKQTFMFAPHVDAGLSGGYNFTSQKGEVNASIGVSFLAIGQTKSDNTVRFLHLRGTFDDQSIGAGIDPIGVNIAKPIPLVDDIWLWAGPTFSSDGISVLGTVSSTF